ncbi:Rieske (2Fe-2S) protein [Marinobacter sp. es.048]|uniref:Rieske (2Fe-2S) protein n=1 Tax=Marinobacter sp. es.048 TaxID=1761795 RepID=UPI003A5D0148
MGMTRILVCHTESGELFAVFDVCPHARQPLAGGRVTGNKIICPKHGACFDLQSGSPLNGVTKASLETLPVRVTSGRIEVYLPKAS